MLYLKAQFENNHSIIIYQAKLKGEAVGRKKETEERSRVSLSFHVLLLRLGKRQEGLEHNGQASRDITGPATEASN